MPAGFQRRVRAETGGGAGVSGATYICGPTDGDVVTDDMLNERYWTGYLDWNEWNEGYHSKRRADKGESLPWRAGWTARQRERDGKNR